MRNPLQQFALSQLGDLQQSLANAADEADRELRGTKLESSAGGGTVRVTANGLGEIIEVKLEPTAVTTEADQVRLLEDLIAAAVRDVIAQANERGAEVRQRKLRDSGPFAMLSQLGINLDLPDK